MREPEDRKRNRDEASGGNGVCVCVSMCGKTEVCRITINNPPPLFAHKEGKGGGRKGIRQ